MNFKLDIRPSYHACYYLTALHLGAFISSVLLTPLNLTIKLIISTGLILSLYSYLQTQHHQNITAITWQKNSGWQINTHHTWQSVKLIRHHFTPWFIVLDFQLVAVKPVQITLFQDSTQPIPLREIIKFIKQTQ